MTIMEVWSNNQNLPIDNVKTPNLSKIGSKELYFMIVPLISDLTTQRQAKKKICWNVLDLKLK